MSYYVIDNNELYHHGIKGQKWGVRRFQNKDGSMTSAGKKREQMKNPIKDALARRQKRKNDKFKNNVTILNKEKKKVYNKISDSRSFSERMKYGEHVWKDAANRVVKKNVSMERAIAQAKRKSDVQRIISRVILGLAGPEAAFRYDIANAQEGPEKVYGYAAVASTVSDKLNNKK